MTARARTPTRRKATKKEATGWRKFLIDAILGKFAPQIRFGVLVLAVLVFALGAAGAQIWAYHNTYLPQVLRDMVISLVAHHYAGDEIPMPEDADYSHSMPYDPESTWGLMLNSRWLMDYALRIIPFFPQERVGPGIYPDYVVVIAWPAETSLGVAGRADCQFDFYGGMLCAIWVNERFYTDPAWNDQRQLLEVTTHELIHIQGGDFMWPDGETWTEKSGILESKTSAATIEVLAAMCNAGDEIACKAFWYNLESTARQTLRVRLRDVDWLYQAFANIFFRDDMDERAARKSIRDHASDKDTLYEQMYKYAAVPYEVFLINGLEGMRMDTQVRQYDYFGHWWLLTMPFDDSADLLGPIWTAWLILLTP